MLSQISVTVTKRPKTLGDSVSTLLYWSSCSNADLKNTSGAKEKMPPLVSRQPGASEKPLRETTGKISNRACVYLGNCLSSGTREGVWRLIQNNPVSLLLKSLHFSLNTFSYSVTFCVRMKLSQITVLGVGKVWREQVETYSWLDELVRSTTTREVSKYLPRFKVVLSVSYVGWVRESESPASSRMAPSSLPYIPTQHIVPRETYFFEIKQGKSCLHKALVESNSTSVPYQYMLNKYLLNEWIKKKEWGALAAFPGKYAVRFSHFSRACWRGTAE